MNIERVNNLRELKVEKGISMNIISTQMTQIYTDLLSEKLKVYNSFFEKSYK